MALYLCASVFQSPDLHPTGSTGDSDRAGGTSDASNPGTVTFGTGLGETSGGENLSLAA